MFKEFMKTSRNWGYAEFKFCSEDYEEFEQNNIVDYLKGAWDVYKCELIHSYLSSITTECDLLILEVECPFDGRSRNLWRPHQHTNYFKQCEGCNLPWLLDMYW